MYDENPGTDGDRPGPPAESPTPRRPVPPGGAPAHRPPPRSADHPLTGRLTWLLIALVCLLLLRFLPYFVEQLQYAITRGRQRAESDVARDALAELPLDQLSKAYQLVSQRAGPSVVHINVRSITQEMPDDEFAWQLRPGQQERRGQGSGVIVDSAGFVLTNNHVVYGATEIEVSLADGRIVPGYVVGADALTDLAVLKISADQLVAAEWGDSDQLEVGALVWAVGSPFGLQHSITSGILSAKNREGTSPYLDFLQTDAAVNPGNSGGPLVDARGRVIGINTAIVGEAFQGISFAIPSSTARDVYERLKADGVFARGWLGVGLADLDEPLARELGLQTTEGVLVRALVRQAPAARAGLLPGDVVIRFNGRDVPNAFTLSRLVAQTEIGSTATLVVLRRGREITLDVEIGARPRS